MYSAPCRDRIGIRWQYRLSHSRPREPFLVRPLTSELRDRNWKTGSRDHPFNKNHQFLTLIFKLTHLKYY